ncbi:hypothetical protein CDL15_Pgr015608 [Punica granatum]|nr:hypothetical protein CDL15_Pgr015608 [Punica granatum]
MASTSNSLPCPTHHLQGRSESQLIRDQPQAVVDQHLIPCVRGGSISSSDHHISCEEGQGLSVFPSLDQNSDQEINSHRSDGNGILSIRWMSSKMRIIHKMKKNSPNSTASEWSSGGNLMKRSEDCEYDHEVVRYAGGSNISTNNGAVRVCSDCNTTTTPLWRSGPRGPKSLCNACGIRQRKARRAMEAAAATMGMATAASTDTSSSRTNNHSKLHKKLMDKIPRPNKKHHNHAHQFKRHNTKTNSSPALPHHSAGKKKQYLFDSFAIGLMSETSSSPGFRRVFPEDEAEAAALLLMELSRGLHHA